MGYAVFWSFIFAYIVYLHRKQMGLARELEDMRRSLND
jgi:CcmD family protein